MNGTSLLALLRSQTGVGSSQIADTEMYQYLNFSYHAVEDYLINEVDPYMFWDEFVVGTVAGQSEYSMPYEDTVNKKYMWKKVLSVAYKYSDSDTYEPLTKKNWEAVNKTEDELAQLGKDETFYALKDNSIFIYPIAENSVGNGLKIEATYGLYDIDASTPETSTFDGNGDLTAMGIFHVHKELKNYHQIIVLGAIPRVKRHRNVEDLVSAENAETVFDNHLRKLGKRLRGRDDGVYHAQIPAFIPNLSM